MVDENAPSNFVITPASSPTDASLQDYSSNISQSLRYPLDRNQAMSLTVNTKVSGFPIIKLLNLLTAQHSENQEELEKKKQFADSLTSTITINSPHLNEDGITQYDVSYEQDRTENQDIDENPFQYFYGQTILSAEDLIGESY
jgi:hypothetical protein